MDPSNVEEDIYAIDPELLGTPGALSLYVVDAPQPAIVDTGAADSVPRILAGLETLGIEPAAVAHVLVTHVHLDHAGGAGALARHLPNATVHVHERGHRYLTDREHLDRLKRSVDRAMGTSDAYGDPEVVPAERCRIVTGGERIDLGDRQLRVLDAPGHAPHHFVAFDPASGGLFSIDAAGMYLAGELRPTTPPPGFDLAANLETVDRLRALEPDRNLYGHYGPGAPGEATTELARYGELLPEWVDRVARLRDTHDDDVAAIVDALGEDWQSPTVHRDVRGVLHYLDSD